MGAAEAEILARVQFAFTVSFHILFPALTIGLASFLMVLEGLWLATGRRAYIDLYGYWSKAFALCFGMGVVSGVVMSYQFGTNWGPFSDATGPILGPLLGYEVMSAFFLEAGFLGIMLFGRTKVGPGLHFFATSMVAFGTLISSFWILAANSWMHTPAGFAQVDGQFVPADWWAVIFNPSFPYRLVHMVLAAYLATALTVAGAAAFQLLRRKLVGDEGERVRLMFSMALWMIVATAPLQLIAGDAHGLNTREHQPAKVAAMEGHWESQEGAPLYLFGIPNMEAERTDFALGIPHLGSLILTHDWNGRVRGLKDFAPEDRPNATVIFWTFRLMVGLGLLMIALGLIGLFLRATGRLYDQPWFQALALAMGPAGYIALLAGWVTTEMGRQPFLVYGLMRTSEGRSPIDAPAVATSLLLFVVVYCAVFGFGTLYMLRLLGRPPEDSSREEPGETRHAALSGRTEAAAE